VAKTWGKTQSSSSGFALPSLVLFSILSFF
jgi:hypothetical protein